MTKDLHPGLGSGALREALDKIVAICSPDREGHFRRLDAKLFSEIYDIATMGCSAHTRCGDKQESSQGGSAIPRAPLPITAALSLSSPIEPPRSGGQWCELASSDGNGGCVYAQPTPQASSEVRERVEAELTAIRGQYDKDYGKTNWFTAMDYFCKRVADALDAPSRQGAGGE